MKNLLTCIFISFLFSANAQKGDELMVYSIQGKVTVIENSKESSLKIGKVLKTGSAIKTQRSAKLTMVCKQGKPLSITKEGTFPVVKWKDSCVTGDNSMTSKYFQYIWGQLYVRSEDYKKEHSAEMGDNERTEAPVRGEKILEINFIDGLDTIKYATGNFALSWITTIEYYGKFHFVLLDSKSGKQLYSDSISGNSILMEKLTRYMRPGNSYSWSVAAGKTDISEGGIITYMPVRKVNQQISMLVKSIDIPEDKATQYFRVAYLLEKSYFLADAFIYYQKAAELSPDTEFFKEKLIEFNKKFRQ